MSGRVTQRTLEKWQNMKHIKHNSNYEHRIVCFSWAKSLYYFNSVSLPVFFLIIQAVGLARCYSSLIYPSLFRSSYVLLHSSGLYYKIFLSSRSSCIRSMCKMILFCMRFEVLTAVKISVLVFWVVTLKMGNSMFLRNVGIYLQVHMALQPRTTSTFYSLFVCFLICCTYLRSV
jgi:hypothetical protein